MAPCWGRSTPTGRGAGAIITFLPRPVVSSGIYSFSAVAMDQSANVKHTSSTYSVTIVAGKPSPPVLNDISPDTGAGSTDGDHQLEDSHILLGTAEPNALINLYSNGNNNPFGTTAADINGNWSYTIPGGGWGDGNYNVTATPTASPASRPSSAPLTVVIDTQPPQQPQVTGISSDTGKNNITTAQNLTFSGTAQPGIAVSVDLNGTLLGVTTAGTTGAWTYNNTGMTLADGNYAITAQAIDIAGNVSNVSNAFQLTVETVPTPVISGVSLITAGSGQQSLSIVGMALPNDQVQISVNGTLLGTVNADGNGNWTFNDMPSSHTVASGVNGFSAVAMDQSANVSVPSPTFQLQVGGGPMAGTSQYAAGTLSGQATPWQPDHHRPRRCHPWLRGGQCVRLLAVRPHAVERPANHHGGGHE